MAKKQKRQAESHVEPKSATSIGSYSSLQMKMVFYAFGISGCAALIYEVLWTRELALVFGSTVYAVSTMLTAFMAGLSFGSYIGGKLADRLKNLVFLFGTFELGIGVFGLLTIPLINSLPAVYFLLYNNLKLTFYTYHIIQFLMCFLIMLIPTSLMGATFPVVSKIETRRIEEVGKDVGGVYAINTVGAILGSFLPGFVLIPLMGVKATTLVAAGLNLIVASLMLMASGRRSRLALIGSALVIFSALGSVGLLWNNQALGFNWWMIGRFKSYSEYQEFRDQFKTVYFAEDSHGPVAVYQGIDGHMFLVNGGKIEGSNQGIDMQTTDLLAYLPVYSARDPKNALVIGLGTGNTLKEVLGFPLDNVVCAEIVAKVIPAARLFVGDEVLKEPRVEMVIADARNYLYTTKGKFDVITSEPSHPTNTSVSNLFTYDFYKLARSKMSEEGIFTQWIPRYMLKREDFIFMLKTFKEVFPHTVVWASYDNAEQQKQQVYPTETIFIGSVNPITRSPEQIIAEIDKKAKSKNVSLFYGIYLTESDVARVLAESGADAPLNKDDKPVLEFIIPQNIINFAYSKEGIQ